MLRAGIAVVRACGLLTGIGLSAFGLSIRRKCRRDTARQSQSDRADYYLVRPRAAITGPLAPEEHLRHRQRLEARRRIRALDRTNLAPEAPWPATEARRQQDHASAGGLEPPFQTRPQGHPYAGPGRDDKARPHVIGVRWHRPGAGPVRGRRRICAEHRRRRARTAKRGTASQDRHAHLDPRGRGRPGDGAARRGPPHQQRIVLARHRRGKRRERSLDVVEGRSPVRAHRLSRTHLHGLECGRRRLCRHRVGSCQGTSRPCSRDLRRGSHARR